MEMIKVYGLRTLDWLMVHGWRVLLILVIMWLAIRAARILADRILKRHIKGQDAEQTKRGETLSDVLSGLLTVSIVGIAGIMILAELDIPIAPVLTTAGVAGVALGFGAQHLVRDIISGFFILLDNQIRVGDVVQIAGKGGLVEKINLRLTVLRDLAGNVHYVRNGEIGVITNMTRDYSRYVFDVGVAYREDVDQVIQVIREVDEDMRRDPTYQDLILEPIEVLGLDQFGDSAVIIKARTKTKPIQQWTVGREFNRRLKKRFDELDIEIPFPHVTLYMGQDKQGQAPPLHVHASGSMEA
ncbi:MAG TPA: mechanosensitive ion channel family protein [Phycisphaerales bacterium]|nr:mechanosensitive ion channel family protein [Phycisphaerales bacterium]